MTTMICPNCKTGKLKPFDETDTFKTLTCDHCKAIVQFRNQNDKWNMLINGASVAASTVAVLQWLGIDSLPDLIHLLSRIFTGNHLDEPTDHLTRKPPFDDFIRGK